MKGSLGCWPGRQCSTARCMCCATKVCPRWHRGRMQSGCLCATSMGCMIMAKSHLWQAWWWARTDRVGVCTDNYVELDGWVSLEPTWGARWRLSKMALPMPQVRCEILKLSLVWSYRQVSTVGVTGIIMMTQLIHGK